MGTAWCRERAVKAQDSKSPFDRVIVKCVNQMSSPASQTTQNTAQIQTSRLTKSSPNAHFEADSSSGWQDVVLCVPDQAPVAPPRRKRQNRESLKSPPPPPPRTPSIHLEVDTPEFRHKSTPSLDVVKPPSREKSTTSLEVGSSLSRQKSRSYSCLPGLIDQESRDESDNLRPPRSVSSMSNRSITSLSDGTSERLDNYLKSCRSFGSLKPEDLINELNQALQSDDSSDSDAWAGIDDWDLGIAEHHCHGSNGSPPLTPTSQLPPKKGRKLAEFTVGEQKAPRKRTKSRKPPDTTTKNTDHPANFESRVKASGEVIKPAQIPVKDFLRHSETSMQEKRRSLDVSPSNSFTFDFSRGGLAPPRSPQIELPGTPNTPRSLSRCSTPLPPQCRDNCTTPPSSPTDNTPSTLLRLLNEYHAAAELIGDEDASKLLQAMGIPEDLDEKSDQHGQERIDAEVESLVNKHPAVTTTTSSGRSSTNQSLAELETALSEYLEASQAKQESDDGDVPVKESAFAPIKQEPPSIKPRAKKYSQEFNPEITITTATESDVKEDVSKESQESSIVPVRPASEDTTTLVEAIKEKAVEALFEPIKDDRQTPAHDVKPVITITVVAEEGDKKVGVIESPRKKPAFQVTD